MRFTVCLGAVSVYDCGRTGCGDHFRAEHRIRHPRFFFRVVGDNRKPLWRKKAYVRHTQPAKAGLVQRIIALGAAKRAPHFGDFCSDQCVGNPIKKINICRIPAAKKMVSEAARQYQSLAGQLMSVRVLIPGSGQGEYLTAALQKLDNAILLEPDLLEQYVMRIDCFVMLGQFESAAEETGLLLERAPDAWYAQVRRVAIRTALGDAPQPIPLPPPRDERAYDIYWAAIAMMHCGDLLATIALSRCAAEKYSESKLKDKSAQVAELARQRLQLDAASRAAV